MGREEAPLASKGHPSTPWRLVPHFLIFNFISFFFINNKGSYIYEKVSIYFKTFLYEGGKSFLKCVFCFVLKIVFNGTW
jgi:hypothetical protein